MGADVQLDGDLLVGVPVPGQLSDLGLPGAQALVGRVWVKLPAARQGSVAGYRDGVIRR
jgi:hypothetical protein